MKFAVNATGARRRSRLFDFEARIDPATASIELPQVKSDSRGSYD